MSNQLTENEWLEAMDAERKEHNGVPLDSIDAAQFCSADVVKSFFERPLSPTGHANVQGPARKRVHDNPRESPMTSFKRRRTTLDQLEAEHELLCAEGARTKRLQQQRMDRLEALPQSKEMDKVLAITGAASEIARAIDGVSLD